MTSLKIMTSCEMTTIQTKHVIILITKQKA